MDENKSNHDDCNCGDDCGCEEEIPTMKIELEDGTEVEWDVIATFPVGDKDYIALAPQDEDELFIYAYHEDENGVVLDNIDDDNEFEAAGKALDELFDEMEAEQAEENKNN